MTERLARSERLSSIHRIVCIPCPQRVRPNASEPYRFEGGLRTPLALDGEAVRGESSLRQASKWTRLRHITPKNRNTRLPKANYRPNVPPRLPILPSRLQNECERPLAPRHNALEGQLC